MHAMLPTKVLRPIIRAPPKEMLTMVLSTSKLPRKPLFTSNVIALLEPPPFVTQGDSCSEIKLADKKLIWYPVAH